MTTVQLKLVFNCLSKNSSNTSAPREGALCLRAPLSEVTLDEVKAIIAKDYNIPACVQSIKWAGQYLDGFEYVKENDELEVTYHSQGDCTQVQETVSWLTDCVTSLQVHGVPTLDNYQSSNYLQLDESLQKKFLNAIEVNIFEPWNDPVIYTNKLHFVSLGGLDLLMKLYTLILQNNWDKMPHTLKCIEFAILHSIWSFSENIPLLKLVTGKGVLNLIIGSLKRLMFSDSLLLSIQNKFKPVEKPTLLDLIEGAIGLLCNFCELKETQDYLVTCHDLLSLLVTMKTNPVFNCVIQLSVSEVLLQVSINKDSHVFLSQREIIYTLLDTLLFEGKGKDFKHNCIASYFNMQLMLRIVLESPSTLSWLLDEPDTFSIILTTLSSLLKETTFNKIMEYMEEVGYHWKALVPNVTILLTPLQHKVPLMLNLQLLAWKLFAYTLSSILKRAEHVKILFEEGLTDFVTCLPWYSAKHSQRRAKMIVDTVWKEFDVPYQPPSLLNMCKAAVSVYHCGLHDVMRLSVPELACKILQEQDT